MPRPSLNISGSNAANSTGVTTTVTVGAGSNRVAFIHVFNRDAGGGDVTSISCTGGTPTQIGTTLAEGNGKSRVYRFVAPGTGSFSVTPTLSAAREHRVIVMVLNDVDQVTPNGTVAQGTLLSRTSNVTDDQILLAFAAVEDGAGQPTPPSFTGTGTATQTLYQDGKEATNSRYFSVASLTPTTGTPVTASFSYAGSGDSASSFALPVTVAATGPTINTQPTAQISRLNGDTTAAVSFTVAATTSGGSLTYQWQEEDSVGGGAYSNISTGGIYAGATSATLTITPTSTAKTGLRYRVVCTDSNGPTTSDAVVLTVFTGPVLSASSGTTNGSGVLAITAVSDDAVTADGEVILVSALYNGTTIARTTIGFGR